MPIDALFQLSLSQVDTAVKYKWTHAEWYDCVKNVRAKFESFETAIKNNHKVKVEISSLGANWRVLLAVITDLEHAIFFENNAPNDKEILIQELEKKAVEIAFLSQSVLNATVLRSKL